jgi:hypothetical protein
MKNSRDEINQIYGSSQNLHFFAHIYHMSNMELKPHSYQLHENADQVLV